LLPVLVFIFFRIHYHYKDVAHSLSLQGRRPELAKHPVRTLILIDDVHAETVRMVDFAKSLDHPWVAINVAIHPEKAEAVKRKWQERIGEGELVVLDSPYRLLVEPIKEYIEKLQKEVPGCFVHVIMGQLVMDSYWTQALHQNSSFIFNLALSGMERIVVTTVPYQIHKRHDDYDTHQEESEDGYRDDEPVKVEATTVEVPKP
jgi:hypothetical protein